MTARSHGVSWRWLRLAGAASLAYLLLMMTAPQASAHHVDISASVSCDGKVVFTAVAWRTTSVAARTNAAVAISYSVDGHNFIHLPPRPQYAFGPADRFTFSDSFRLGHPLPQAVVVAAQAVDSWGDGASPGEAHTTAPVHLPLCPATPSADQSSAAPTRAVSSATPAPADSSSSGTVVSQVAARPRQQAQSPARIGLIAAVSAAGVVLLGAGVWALRKVLSG
jgi:hypothetical protein